MQEKNLLLFVVIVLAALFLISSFSGTKVLTGQSVNTGSRGVESCTDSDGYDVFVSGSVMTTTGASVKEYTDRCSGGDGMRVLENYCEGNVRKFSYEWCRDGMRCSSGACY